MSNKILIRTSPSSEDLRSKVSSSGTVDWTSAYRTEDRIFDQATANIMAFQGLAGLGGVGPVRFPAQGDAHMPYLSIREAGPYRNPAKAASVPEGDLAAYTTHAFMAANPEIWNDPEEDAIWADW